MIRKATILFCDNEHGYSNVCFPDLGAMAEDATQQLFINGPTPVNTLRKDAKKAGWGRINGADYCPGCMEIGI